MREIRTRIWATLRRERKFAVFFGGVLILSLTGPFGTYESLDIYERLVFWLVALAGVGFFMHILIITSLASCHPFNLPKVVKIGIGAILAGLPGAAVVIFVHGVFHPPPVMAENLLIIWMQVALIGWALGVIEFHDYDDAPPPERSGRTPFHKRLPPELGDDIISISMQDHYAEVTTTLGSHMVLMRLSDAMQELEHAPGLQVHRSHYAMIAHLERLYRAGARQRVRLSDGRDLPVSATYKDAVRRAIRDRDVSRDHK